VILPDANLLLYAYDASSPFHRVCSNWWSKTLDGRELVGVCVPVLFAFVRISTSPRAFTRPLTIDEAAENVTKWLEQPSVQLLELQPADIHRALALLHQAGTGGNLTTDAQVAALALRLAAVVHTADTDYERFPNLNWYNPIRD
jgi:toxin-antitoxin system PIN domain toxin